MHYNDLDKFHIYTNNCRAMLTYKLSYLTNKRIFLYDKLHVSSFKRHFKMEKNGVILFVISFTALEIFMILYYVNKITDDLTMFSQRGAKTQNEEYLWNK